MGREIINRGINRKGKRNKGRIDLIRMIMKLMRDGERKGIGRGKKGKIGRCFKKTKIKLKEKEEILNLLLSILMRTQIY